MRSWESQPCDLTPVVNGGFEMYFSIFVSYVEDYWEVHGHTFGLLAHTCLILSLYLVLPIIWAEWVSHVNKSV